MTASPETSKPKGESKLTEIASLVVTAIWMIALFTGQEWWLPSLLIGYLVVVPLISVIWGDDSEDEDDYNEDDEDAIDKDLATGRTALTRPKRDALEVLRDRYAHGELTEDQFERKVEVLLDTESLENAEEWVLDTRATHDSPDGLDARPESAKEQEEAEAPKQIKK